MAQLDSTGHSLTSMSGDQADQADKADQADQATWQVTPPSRLTRPRPGDTATTGNSG